MSQLKVALIKKGGIKYFPKQLLKQSIEWSA